MPTGRDLGRALALILACFLLLCAYRAHSAKVGPFYGLDEAGKFKAAPRREINLRDVPSPKYGHEGDRP